MDVQHTPGSLYLSYSGSRHPKVSFSFVRNSSCTPRVLAEYTHAPHHVFFCHNCSLVPVCSRLYQRSSETWKGRYVIIFWIVAISLGRRAGNRKFSLCLGCRAGNRVLSLWFGGSIHAAREVRVIELVKQIVSHEIAERQLGR